jgi:ribonuclease P/MRP protein subunit RPP1
MSVDIITFDFSQRIDYKFKRTSVQPAITRGIFFEINYSQGIRDATGRRYLISNAMELIKKTKGKNIIMSSDALKALDVRSPYDMANLYKLY